MFLNSLFLKFLQLIILYIFNIPTLLKSIFSSLVPIICINFYFSNSKRIVYFTMGNLLNKNTKPESRKVYLTESPESVPSVPLNQANNDFQVYISYELLK